jgi:predicted adenine nucleotide alpha hydrolase (AANH) superfamily ATPase
MNNKILLHICCGICALESINRLIHQQYIVIGYFFNPNIYPEEEYLKRKQVVENVAEIYNINVIYDEKYDHHLWQKICGIYENEPEGGKRCFLCYELRLKKTYEIMEKENFDFFTTTLTISPYKKSNLIFDIGEKIGGEKFLKINFKKQDGYKKTIELAKNFGFYRQDYCGCEFSMKRDTHL